MTDRFDDRIDTWAAEFDAAPEARPLPAAARAASSEILRTFLRGACATGSDPSQISEGDVRAGLEAAARNLASGSDLWGILPDMVAGFLAMLERQGRVAHGAVLGAYARSIRSTLPYAARAGRPGPGTTIRRKYSKLGPNDPCPCGSGKKWKKCCRSQFEGGA